MKAAWTARSTVTCQRCHKTFIRDKSIRKFCSRHCSLKGRPTKGYRHVTVRGKTTTEQRYVMEQYIGRPLHPFESVHHKNGVRTDNRISNLELWTRPHPYGQRVSDLVSFVVEHYADHVRKAIT
jgi:hypothetical protein